MIRLLFFVLWSPVWEVYHVLCCGKAQNTGEQNSLFDSLFVIVLNFATLESGWKMTLTAQTLHSHLSTVFT